MLLFAVGAPFTRGPSLFRTAPSEVPYVRQSVEVSASRQLLISVHFGPVNPGVSIG